MGLPAEVFDHSTVGWEAAWRRFVRVERGARGVRAYPGAPSVEGISPGVPPPAPPGWRFLYGGKRATLGEASGHGVWSRAAPGLPLVRFPLSPEGQGMAAAVFDEAESFGAGADGSLPIVRAISGLTLLGGFGFPTLTGHRYRIFFGPRGMRFVASWDTTIAWTPYEDVLGIHIGGPGLVTTGAHVFGGGFGVKGAVEGMAIAALINSLTTKTRIQTVIKVTTVSGEQFFFCDQSSPQWLEIHLSPVYGQIRAAASKKALAADTDEPVGTADRDPVAQLARLAELKERGFISEEEFERGKAKLLGDL